MAYIIAEMKNLQMSFKRKEWENMKRNKTRTQRGAKKFLSVALIASMLIPSTLNGYTAYAADLFSDQGMNELDEFTDKAGEEDGKSVDTVEMPEAIEIFSDKGLNATEGNKNVMISTDDDAKVNEAVIYDVTNNHDGTLSVNTDPKIVGNPGELKKSYITGYNWADSDSSTNYKQYYNSEVNFPDKQYIMSEHSFYKIPENRKISINFWNNPSYPAAFTVFWVASKKEDSYVAALFQSIENPVKVDYDFDGGTGGPTTDYVWTKDNIWKSDYDTKPIKKGYIFRGWYTEREGKGAEITSVADAVQNATKDQAFGGKKITLYAYYESHTHSWQYEKSGNTIKAYCLGSDKCDYYGTSLETANKLATLTLEFNGDKQISYSGQPYNGVNIPDKEEFSTATGESVTVKYEGRDGTDYNESETAPTDSGKYTVKVYVGDSGQAENCRLTDNFEITKASINPQISLDNITYGQSEVPEIRVYGNKGNGDITYQYKSRESNDDTYITINEAADLKELSVGKYTLKAVVGKTKNYKGGSAVCDFEVIKANAISGDSQVSISDWTYGENASQPSVSGLSSEQQDKVTYSYYLDEECTIPTSFDNSGADEEGKIPKNAGTYYVKAEIPVTTNYNSGTVTGSFAIKPLPVTVEWSDSEFTYNRTQHTVTATITNALLGDELMLTYDGNTGTNAGGYEAKITSLGNTNYSLKDESGNPIAKISHSWKIKPKEVTVTAHNLSKHIGNKNPDFGNTNEKYDVVGLEKDDKIYGVRLERKSKQEDAGTYENDIVVTIDPNDAINNSNYKVKLVNGTFTITDHDWTPEEVVTPATAWSEGMKVKTCKVAECSYHQNGKYYTIPKTGEEDDEYADCIDQYTQITGSDITKAVLNNKKSQFLLSESNIFTSEEKEEIENRWNNKNKAEAWLRITTPSFEQNLLDLIRNETKKIAGTEVPDCFFDASLYSKFPGKAESNIKDAGIPINIRIQIPDNMVNKQPYTIRTYKVLRLHQDTNNQYSFDILDASFNSSTNEVTFETDKFSIFALTYKDTYYSPSYPVTGIKVSPESITLTKKDETAQLTAEVTPPYADNKKVTWKSSDEKVATVDENGKVTAVGNGTATITATSVSGSYTATVSITVKIPVEIKKLTIEAEKETLTQIGETTELKVKIEPENADEQKLTWKSDNEMVVAVDENGKVTAVGNGTATLTVTTEDGKVTASVTITVKIPEKPVINKTTGFGRLRARSAKQTKTSVTLQWNRLNDVDGYLIYGNRCNGNGKTYKYKKLATITNGKTQTWVQKGLKKGTFYKYVVKAYKLVDGKKVVTDISISVHTVTQGGAYGIAKSVSVTKIGNKKNTLGVTLKKGQKAQITAKEVKKDNKIKHHRKLCYESSNTEVATVTSKGLIQAKGKGTCKIWVYAQNGVYKELTITVK